MDLPANIALGAPMHETKRDLVIQLATQAGMLLEDVSAPLILLPSQNDDQLFTILKQSANQLERANNLIKAAQALLE